MSVRNMLVNSQVFLSQNIDCGYVDSTQRILKAKCFPSSFGIHYENMSMEYATSYSTVKRYK